jgi:uncharacterized membrane protein
MEIAKKNHLVLLLKCRPGDFVVLDSVLAKIEPCEGVNDNVAKDVRGTFIFGTQRTHLQDVEFSIEQLVEVAVRALSPGVNDPFTAINCIDRIGAALCLLAQRSFPSHLRHDEQGKLRVVARPVTFSGIVNAAFDPIRQYGRSSAAVTIRLLEAIAIIARCVRREGDRRALLNQALMIERGSHEALPEERDRADVQERFRNALQALERCSVD